MNDKSATDQELAKLRDGLPRFWYALYTGSLAAGFNDTQALALTQTFILSQCPHGIRPPNPTGDEKKEE